jgi:hypothetical protein
LKYKDKERLVECWAKKVERTGQQVPRLLILTTEHLMAFDQSLNVTYKTRIKKFNAFVISASSGEVVLQVNKGKAQKERDFHMDSILSKDDLI